MAFSVSGDLYVSNAWKQDSKLLVFGPADSQGKHTYKSTFASMDTVESLVHPYGLAFAQDGSLFVSQQDTYVVTRLSSGGTPAATGSYWVQTYPDSTFFPGTWAPGAEKPDNGEYESKPDTVKVSDGGLTEPRGVAVSSCRLFVADDSSQHVKAYDLNTGEYMGNVLELNGGKPIGLAYSKEEGVLYVAARGSDDVHRVNVHDCNHDCDHDKVITAKEGDATLVDAAGIAVGPTTPEGHTTLYVASRTGKAVNEYILDGKQLVSSRVLNGKFTGTPEQILVAPQAPSASDEFIV
eukprot:TRINITY_DN23571_c0_g1_i6.p2 TRINITY_DN23571_c0_g1~~TRINITY_DN23571_c0_g1_i6.p2  ORF type:complete len:294 (+),score=63.12 TRINITY_DN23571_c0_g1_i6:112-993(+)